MKHPFLASSAALLAALLTACGGSPNTDPDGDVDQNTAVMQDRAFQVENAAGGVLGSVRIVDVADGVEVRLNVTSIPEGEHAIHFHEVGACDGPDFTSAGGHYNPMGVNHGFEADSPNPHPGDMRNFTAPASGLVNTTLENTRVSLSRREGFAPLFDADGTALIIHAGPDDYESQPSGAAGGRIACAVITPGN